MRLIIFSILEYNEMLIYYFASQGGGVGISILEYYDIIGENSVSELYFDEKKGPRRAQ